jgi:hypothetical protein
MTIEPWTFEPLEMDADPCWNIYDPNLGVHVATFYDHDRARDYLRWVNKKQAKKQAEKRAQRLRQSLTALSWASHPKHASTDTPAAKAPFWGGTVRPDADDDGRC